MVLQRLLHFSRILTFVIFCLSFLFFSPVRANEASDLLNCQFWDCINKPNFTINVSNLSPGGTSLWGSSGQATIKNVLASLIDKLIIAFWVLSLFIMTIGAGYMIIHHGQDEFLSRGKSIFIAGLTSLAVALSAGLIVKFISYLLYQ